MVNRELPPGKIIQGKLTRQLRDNHRQANFYKTIATISGSNLTTIPSWWGESAFVLAEAPTISTYGPNYSFKAFCRPLTAFELNFTKRQQTMHQSILYQLALAAIASAACDSWAVTEASARLLSSQSYGDPASFKQLLNPSAIYIENGKEIPIDDSILKKKLRIDGNKTFKDLVDCATFTEIIVADAKEPYVIGTQLRISPNNGGVDRVDTIVTKPGDWLFNATNTLYWASKEDWSAIPSAKLDKRETIKKAADAYLDLFSDSKVVVPWGTPCARLEGGAYTGKGLANDTCNVGVPSGVPMKNRRYVIDEAYGQVDVMLQMGAHEWPDSHQFRVEGGKLRYVHTMTWCGIPNCGVE